MKNILKSINNLLKVKSLFSLMCIYIIIYSLHNNIIESDILMSIVYLIVGFYFGKGKEESDSNES